MKIGRRLIVDEGLASVQARRIATEAGCAVGSIYNVFQDLDALIIALNTVTLGELGSALKTAHDASKTAPTHARLLALAHAYFDFAADDRQLWRAIFEHHLPEGAKAPPEYRDDQNRLFALVEDCLVGDIADDGDRRSAARALFASVHGIVSLSLDRKLGEFEPDETRKQIEFLVGCTARGLRQN